MIVFNDLPRQDGIPLHQRTQRSLDLVFDQTAHPQELGLEIL
jgi:hypothetical protein